MIARAGVRAVAAVVVSAGRRRAERGEAKQACKGDDADAQNPKRVLLLKSLGRRPARSGSLSFQCRSHEASQHLPYGWTQQHKRVACQILRCLYRLAPGPSCVKVPSAVQNGRGCPMPFRARKSIKVVPGVQLNLSKTGIGASVGFGPGRYSVHSSGARWFRPGQVFPASTSRRA
jgi:Protein of unknown function (DUF4236)